MARRQRVTASDHADSVGLCAGVVQTHSRGRHKDPQCRYSNHQQGGPHTSQHAPGVRALFFSHLLLLNPASDILLFPLPARAPPGYASHSQLLQLPDVLFAGYKVPHPLEPRFLLKIQTTSSSTPIQAVQEACKALIVTLSRMRDAFQREFDTAKTMGTSMGIDAAAADAQTQQGQMQSLGAGMGNAMDEGLGAGAADGAYEEGYQPGGFSEFI